MIKAYKFLPHVTFLGLVILIFSPSLIEIRNRWPFLIVVVGIEIAFIVYRKSKAANDIALIFFVFLIVWEFGTTKIPNQYRSILPAPERVFAVFYTDRRLIFKGIINSMSLLFGAMFLALIFGVSLGIVVGWFERPRRTFLPIAKVLRISSIIS
ncbi:MAG: hypothetical protein LBG14_06920 [Treponema sp.]|jgi:NitT/TauT family transport system permease protein|nr:hypothetical protein [Treponema sp.]